jgi:alpha-L-arabinofuranosidase
MISRAYQPQVVDASVTGADGDLDVTATGSGEGARLIVQVANLGAKPRSSRIVLEGFAPSRPVATLEELAGPLDSTNPADDPTRIQPRHAEWRHTSPDGAVRYTFPPHSFTILRFE